MFAFERYKKVSHSDGTIQFRVPKEWTNEVDDDKNRVLWNENRNSGTLRVTLLIAKKEYNASSNPAVEFLGPKEPLPIALNNGNAYRNYFKEAEENGKKTIIFFFEIGNYVKPVRYRLALFTYTIYAAQEKETETQNQIKWLKEELPNTVFSDVAQEWEI